MIEMDMDLSGKVALVTGGSRGLGKEIAMAMAGKGAKIAICGRKQESLDQTLEEFQEHGFEVIVQSAHVAKSDQVEKLFQVIMSKFERIDILVNNVGMNIFTPSVSEVDEGLWDKIIATNLKGTFLVSQQAIRLMKKRSGGKIINISSVAARKAARGMGVYSVAKAAIEMLTRVMAAELAQDHINVNAVAPCMIKTPFSQPFWSDEDLIKEITKMIPLGRIAEAREVVGAVLFLASNLSDFITGEVITVDGGSMSW